MTFLEGVHQLSRFVTAIYDIGCLGELKHLLLHRDDLAGLLEEACHDFLVLSYDTIVGDVCEVGQSMPGPPSHPLVD